MRLIKMLKEFLENFLLLTPAQRKSMHKVIARISRLKEFKEKDGFMAITEISLEGRVPYEYSSLRDKNFTSKSGFLFRIYFYIKKDGVIYLSNFEEIE